MLSVIVHAIPEKSTNKTCYHGNVTDSICYYGKKTASMRYHDKKIDNMCYHRKRQITCAVMKKNVKKSDDMCYHGQTTFLVSFFKIVGRFRLAHINHRTFAIMDSLR